MDPMKPTQPTQEEQMFYNIMKKFQDLEDSISMLRRENSELKEKLNSKLDFIENLSITNCPTIDPTIRLEASQKVTDYIESKQQQAELQSLSSQFL